MKLPYIFKILILLTFVSHTISCTAQVTVIPTPSYNIGSTQISDNDGMIMVFVPAGEFSMGSNDGPMDEKPVHTVTLPDFWMDQTEVTNAMFAKFINETQYKTDAEKGGCSSVIDRSNATWSCLTDAVWNHPQGLNSNLEGLDMHPVVQVSWNDAQAYCNWAGRRLPTEAEWEKAARGNDARTFPWGNDPVADNLLNLADVAYGTPWAVRTIDDNYAFTSPVGHYPDGRSPYGAFDMAGNVWEWGSSLYRPYPYDSSDGREDIKAAGTHILRGGSWDDFVINVRSAIRFRGGPTFRVAYIGFRCADSP